MSKITTNLAVILGLITVVFAGYYIYTQQDSGVLDFTAGDQVTEDMLRNTQVFIGYGQTLRQVTLQVEFFEDQRFRSLQGFTTPIQDRPIGRSNPFNDAAGGVTTSEQ